jgi:hypothetical protein
MASRRASLARVKVKFPDQIWISDIFEKFPNVKMEIEYFLPYDLEKSIILLLKYKISILME